MHRTWLIEVEYLKASRIVSMQTVEGVIERLESTGASLALSAATVKAHHIGEDEVRLLYDSSPHPLPPGVVVEGDGPARVIRIPFDWDGFIEHREDRPATSGT